MNKAFESNATATTLENRDSEIISYEAPSIQYEQIKLNYNFKQYFETSLISQNFFKKKLKKKTSYQKSYKLYIGAQDYNIDFRGANRQFS